MIERWIFFALLFLLSEAAGLGERFNLREWRIPWPGSIQADSRRAQNRLALECPRIFEEMFFNVFFALNKWGVFDKNNFHRRTQTVKWSCLMHPESMMKCIANTIISCCEKNIFVITSSSKQKHSHVADRDRETMGHSLFSTKWAHYYVTSCL